MARGRAGLEAGRPVAGDNPSGHYSSFCARTGISQLRPSVRSVLVLFYVVTLLMVSAGLPWSIPQAQADSRTVSVAVYKVVPFTMQDGDRFSGFTLDLWNEIAQRSQWNTRIVESSSVAEQLSDVATGGADVAVSAVSITSDRETRFDFSQPYLNAGLQIIVPARTAKPTTAGLSGFLRLLFSKSMLVWLAAALVITVVPAHLLWWVEGRESRSEISPRYFPGIFQAFGWGLGILAANGDSPPRHWITRTMGILWGFVGIIFVAYYTATLTATLTVSKLTTPITGPADLYGRKVATVSDTSSAAYLDRIGIQVTKMPAIDDCYRALRDSQIEAVVYDAPVLRYFLAHDGAGVAVTAGPVFHDEDYGFAFRIGSDLRKPVDQSLLAMREDGTFELIERKWFGDTLAVSSEGSR